jgi:hypothetical protein
VITIGTIYFDIQNLRLTEYVYVFRVTLRKESDYFLNTFKPLVFVTETQFTFSGRGTKFYTLYRWIWVSTSYAALIAHDVMYNI